MNVTPTDQGKDIVERKLADVALSFEVTVSWAQFAAYAATIATELHSNHEVIMSRDEIAVMPQILDDFRKAVTESFESHIFNLDRDVYVSEEYVARTFKSLIDHQAIESERARIELLHNQKSVLVKIEEGEQAIVVPEKNLLRCLATLRAAGLMPDDYSNDDY